MRQICFITISTFFIAGIFISKGLADSDALIFGQQISKVGLLVRDKKYNDISRLAARIEKTADNNGDDFITYARKFVFFSAQGYGHNDDKVVSMCKKLSSKAILTSTDFSPRIGQQIELLEWERQILQKDDETAYLLIKERKDKAEQILSRWNKILSFIDDTWDENKVVIQYLVTVPWDAFKVPVGGSGPISFPPSEAIEDIEIRKKYQAQIDKALEIQKRVDLQQIAKNVWELKRNVVKMYIIDLYSLHPFATAELETLLNTHKIDAAFSKEILDAVHKKEMEHPDDGFRIWRSKDKLFEADAKFVSANDKEVTIEKRDGKRTTIELKLLRKTDEVYVSEQLAPKPEKPETDSLP